MKGICPGSNLAACTVSTGFVKSRKGLAGFILAGILCSGLPTALPQSGGRIGGPSGGQVAGAAVGVGAAIAVVTVVLINRGDHSLTGCVSNGPNGIKLKAGDSKVYSLQGDAANIKAGDKIKVHGSKVKRAKGADGDQTFTVDKVSKDYGPCSADIARQANGAH